jgi:hypothetical protein
MPWLLLGDFNEILFSWEKEGGAPRSLQCMKRFQDCLSDCCLEDLGYIGDIFTWRRGSLRERLDRAVANGEWNNRFPLCRVENGEMTKSDHRPVTVNTEYLANTHAINPGIKRFEARWLQEETVDLIVQNAWDRARAMGLNHDFMHKTAEVHRELHAWDRRELKVPRRRIDQLKSELEILRRGPITDESTAEQKEILLKIELLLDQEEIHWVQRGRANWLRHGDRNTSFFHNFASTRKKKNTIKYIIDEAGNKWDDPQGMSNLIKFNFDTLFTSEVLEPSEEVLSKIPKKVTTEMNRSLTRAFSEEEVKKALFQIGDLKAPGPDGMPALFSRNSGKLWVTRYRERFWLS